MTRTLLFMLSSLAILVGSLWMLSSSDSSVRNQTNSVVLFCAASNRAVVEAILNDYQKEFGLSVQVQYGPSQTLLATMEVSQTCDLFLPADDSYLTLAKSKGLVDEILPLASMAIGVAVPKGNPKRIQSLNDLLKDEFRFVQANTQTAAIGKLTREFLSKSGQWDAIDHATAAYRLSVTDVANDVAVNAADAGIVYDAVLHTYPTLEFIQVPELADARARIAVGLARQTARSDQALRLAQYLAAPDRGGKRYREFGFTLD